MDFLKCNICFSKYNETNQRPRSLSCGHTFCESCLNATVKNKILICPRCRKKHRVNSVCEIPVNFDLEGIIKSLNPPSEDQNEGAHSRPLEEDNSLAKSKMKELGSLKSLLDQQEISLEAQKELLKSSAGMCIEHPGKDLKFRCSLHKSWVCEKCIQDQGDHPRNKCNIISFKEEIEVRKQEYKKTLDNEGEICDASLSSIETHMAHLKDEIENHICLANKLQTLVNMHRKAEENLQKQVTCFQKDLDKGKKLRKSLSAVESTNLNSVTLGESNTARESMQSKITEGNNWRNLSHKKVEAGKIVIERSAIFAMATKLMLEYKENNFVIQESDITQTNCDMQKATDKCDNKIDSGYINLLRKNLNMFSHLYKDQLNNVTKSLHKFYDYEELIAKIQLVMLGLVYTYGNNTEVHVPTWAISSSNEDGMIRAAPITRRCGRFLLHSLKSYHSLPPMAITLPYEVVRRLCKSNSMVFLDICKDHNYIGAINIELFHEKPRGKAMLNYCTGEKGWSYMDATFSTFKSHNFCGFSEFNTFPSSLEQVFECRETACKKGTVTPVYDDKGLVPINDCSFGVILQDSPSRVDGFGLAASGLSLMKDLENEDCHISDCGIII